jgi:hypothetical protein
VGIIGAIIFGMAAIYAGIAQQRVGLDDAKIDCRYRVQLLRDRVIALTNQSLQSWLRDQDDQPEVVSTLIRETQVACATRDPQSANELQRLESHLVGYEQWRASQAKALDVLAQ